MVNIYNLLHETKKQVQIFTKCFKYQRQAIRPHIAEVRYKRATGSMRSSGLTTCSVFGHWSKST